jgi:glutathione S-transferase
MAPIDIYGMQLSAPVRIVEMTAECLGVEYTFKSVDLMKGEHMTPEYLKINPMHNIPAIVDGEFAMNESRAAAGYLVNKYGKDDALYPKDPETRCRVDQRLYFDMGVFYKAFGDIVYPVMMPDNGMPQAGEKQHARMKEVMGWLNSYVADGKFAAGTTQLTIADVALVATYSTIKETGAVDLSEYKDAEAWFTKCTALIPNYEKANGEGAAAFGAWFKSKSA